MALTEAGSLTTRAGAALRALAVATTLLAGWGAAAQVNGVSDKEVVFGMCAPFSGAAKELGRQMRTGLEVAFAAANEAGGVHGRQVRLVAGDDGYEPARTGPCMKELVEGRKVFGIVGNVGTPTTAVALPYALDRNLLFFGAFTGAALLRNDPPDRYVFNYRASYAEETAAMVSYLVEVRRIAPSQIAVFAQEDAFGDAGFDGVARVMRKYKRNPRAVVRVGYKRNTADVQDAVRRIQQLAPELRAVVMVATYRAASRFIMGLKDAGVRLLYSNVSFVGSNELAEELVQAGGRYADGVMVTQVVPLPTSKATPILRYRQQLARFGEGAQPDFVSLEGYIAGNLLIEGLKRAGRALDTEVLVDALEGIRGLDLGLGAPLGFGPSEHQASHRVWGSVLDASGTFRPLELE